ncbi:hypothetical protein QBC41DRAFT_25003 [Cercophora samala]|uniref:Uncharacterized protein n=1 Tax=Cercophora samala TaxID=330535 RepID=A0AA39ZK37_9PEZI|nr:hypothetical protein QBC41DRAFT_25003 [Cercophora samala]
MCWPTVPKHPWCDCTLDQMLTVNGTPSCPHHIWISPYGLSYHPAEISEALSTINRPDIQWTPCDMYDRASTYGGDWAHQDCYRLHRGQHLQTIPPPGYKAFLPWDGLCAQCGGWGAGNGYSLPLVPLTYAPVDSHGPVRYRYQLPDGSPLDSDADAALTGMRREEGSADEMIYVSMDQATIYLLPLGPAPLPSNLLDRTERPDSRRIKTDRLADFVKNTCS